MDKLESLYKVPENVPEADKPALTEKLEKMKKFAATHGKDYDWSLNDFEIGCPLGRGKFGRVYLARDVHCHVTVALKLMHKSEIVRNRCERQVLREIEIQSHLRHPNILTLFTYFDDPRFIVLALEYAAGGELYKHLQNQPNGRFSADKAAKYLYQVVGALNYCHKKRVIHRDIKPENILISAEDNIKLSDFGWSVHAPSSTRRTMCGTLDYLPPEMVSHESYHTNVDNWCVGVLLYEFITGKAPFETPSTQSTYNKITSLDYTFPDYVTEGAKDLIQQLLRLKAEERLSLSEVQKHFWIQANYPEARK